MTIGTPQTILLSAYLFAIAFAIAKQGKPRPRINFYVVGIMFLAELYILKWGGFFVEFGIPQAIFGLINFLGLTHNAMNHGRSHVAGVWSGPVACLAAAISFCIYYFGGFFG